MPRVGDAKSLPSRRPGAHEALGLCTLRAAWKMSWPLEVGGRQRQGLKLPKTACHLNCGTSAGPSLPQLAPSHASSPKPFLAALGGRLAAGQHIMAACSALVCSSRGSGQLRLSPGAGGRLVGGGGALRLRRSLAPSPSPAPQQQRQQRLQPAQVWPFDLAWGASVDYQTLWDTLPQNLFALSLFPCELGHAGRCVSCGFGWEPWKKQRSCFVPPEAAAKPPLIPPGPRTAHALTVAGQPSPQTWASCTT